MIMCKGMFTSRDIFRYDDTIVAVSKIEIGASIKGNGGCVSTILHTRV
jgi:hypothetical protein